MKLFKYPLSFEWDKGNKDKNFQKHRVANEECEEIFFDPNKRIANAIVKVRGENRYLLIGATKTKRLLFVVFTIRGQKIRIISARDLNQKERKQYDQ